MTDYFFSFDEKIPNAITDLVAHSAVLFSGSRNFVVRQPFQAIRIIYCLFIFSIILS